MKETVLIIDDDEAILRSLKRLLISNYSVVCYSDPYAAIEYAKQNALDLVICDLLMPSLSGLAVLEKIKAVKPYSSRMLLTGYAEMEASKHAVKDKVATMITAKPWDNFELSMLVEILIENSKLRQLHCIDSLTS